jgi:hypothetical protein
MLHLLLSHFPPFQKNEIFAIFVKMIDPNSPVYCKIQPFEGCMNDTFYRVGGNYTKETKTKIYENGFHCCANFLQCFLFYGDKEHGSYFRVQLGTDVEEENGDVFCSNEMRVIEEWDPKKVEESITEEMCLEAVQKYGNALQHIPEKLKTDNLCFWAVSNHGRALQFVPENMKTDQLCHVAVGNHCDAIDFVPEKMRTHKILTLSISNRCRSASVLCKGLLQHVPEIMRTDNLCYSAVLFCGFQLSFVPENMKTPEVCLKAVSNCGGALEFVPEKLKTFQMCLTAVLERREHAFEHVPEKLKLCLTK